jgi:hypothetical protein
VYPGGGVASGIGHSTLCYGTRDTVRFTDLGRDSSSDEVPETPEKGVRAARLSVGELLDLGRARLSGGILVRGSGFTTLKLNHTQVVTDAALRDAVLEVVLKSRRWHLR